MRALILIGSLEIPRRARGHSGGLATLNIRHGGYDTSHPAVGPTENAVLIAARLCIERSWALDESLDPRHVWCTEVDGACVSGVYMPQNTAKLPYWEELIRDAERTDIDLLIGDFNTGTNDLDKDP